MIRNAWCLPGNALVLLAVVLGACRSEPDLPVSIAHPDPRPARIVEEGEVPFVEHVAPRDSLLVHDRLPPPEARLLFFRGRGVSRDSSGRSYLPDPAGSRILVVGNGLRVESTIGGPSLDRGGLGLPLSVAATPGGDVFVSDVEHPRGLLFFEAGGRFVGASRPPILNGNLAAGRGSELWASRSPYILGFEPTAGGDPLLYRFDPLRGRGSGIAEIEPVQAPAWNRLANAGAVAARPDGTAFFAFLLRNELRAYDTAGRLLWRARRRLHFEPEPPTVERVGGEPHMRVHPVTQAISIGPDGLLYALTASDSPEGAAAAAPEGRPDSDASVHGEPAGRRRIEVWDPGDGTLLRASTVPGTWTSLAADEAGRVHRVDPGPIDATAPEPERAPLPDVSLRSFEGDTVFFAAYRGKALLVNFWASWCEPCKKELPQLAAHYETLDRDRVEFVGISEDSDTTAARTFAARLRLPFPLFFGQGRMREHFRYVGLPYTLVVDYRGRIVEEIHGFGSEASWRRLTATLDREIERAVPDPEAVRRAGRDAGDAEEHAVHGEGHGAARAHRHDVAGIRSSPGATVRTPPVRIGRRADVSRRPRSSRP